MLSHRVRTHQESVRDSVTATATATARFCSRIVGKVRRAYREVSADSEDIAEGTVPTRPGFPAKTLRPRPAPLQEFRARGMKRTGRAP